MNKRVRSINSKEKHELMCIETSSTNKVSSHEKSCEPFNLHFHIFSESIHNIVPQHYSYVYKYIYENSNTYIHIMSLADLQV
jgi:hypothetical protein